LYLPPCRKTMPASISVFLSSLAEGRFIIEARQFDQPWEVIVEPEEMSQLLVVITAYPVEQP
jgi:hypothetical protein